MNSIKQNKEKLIVSIALKDNNNTVIEKSGIIESRK